MQRGGLAGRLAKLERTAGPRRTVDRCATCGLEHARKVTLDEIRALVRVIGETPVPEPPPGTVRPGPFCLCACCAEYRGLAELTHR
jgi:hypothetical protein